MTAKRKKKLMTDLGKVLSKNMYQLLINTASDPTLIAIADGHNKILASRKIADRRQLSETILRTIDELAREVKVPLNELSVIGIVEGPGPFTALRIGASVANALGYANKTPLVPVPADEAKTSIKFSKTVTEKYLDKKTVGAVLPNYGREPMGAK